MEDFKKKGFLPKTILLYYAQGKERKAMVEIDAFEDGEVEHEELLHEDKENSMQILEEIDEEIDEISNNFNLDKLEKKAFRGFLKALDDNEMNRILDILGKNFLKYIKIDNSSINKATILKAYIQNIAYGRDRADIKEDLGMSKQGIRVEIENAQRIISEMLSMEPVSEEEKELNDEIVKIFKDNNLELIKNNFTKIQARRGYRKKWKEAFGEAKKVFNTKVPTISVINLFHKINFLKRHAKKYYISDAEKKLLGKSNLAPNKLLELAKEKGINAIDGVEVNLNNIGVLISRIELRRDSLNDSPFKANIEKNIEMFKKDFEGGR